MNESKFIKTISRFPGKKVMVIGDLILDQYIWGDVSRISPEAPVPVVLVDRESFMPGGAANVASSISALGGNPVICGLVGADFWGKMLETQLEEMRVDTCGIVSDSVRRTSLKTRIVARHQQVVRVDREVLGEIDVAARKKVVNSLKENIKDLKAVIIEDYGKGLITPPLIKEVVSICRKHGVIVTVDPKENHFSYYRGVTCITPNQHEAGKAVGITINNADSLKAAGKKLLTKLDLEAVLITLGENGMCLFERNGRIRQIPTMAQEVFDVSGAGDTVIGTFTLALAAGAGFEEASVISNYAAGIVVGKVGVATCDRDELTDAIKGSFKTASVDIDRKGRK